jgi:cytochrome c553
MMRAAVLSSAFAASLSLALSGAARTAGPDAHEGKAISVQCAACHGNNGISVDNNIPNLAGQHYRYLVTAMLAFKNNTRPSPTMHVYAAPLSNEQIDDIAAYFASIPITTETPKPKN